MTDRSEKIFGNPVSRRDYDKAQGSKQKYINRFGDDSGADYPAVLKRNEHIGDILGVRDIRVGTDPGEPDEPFAWTDDGWKGRGEAPLIYEAHVGMAQEDERVGTYREFTRNVLPRIKADGYNTIQLMGIMEHPYYASFGYQVSNFYAASGWYGEPEDLKELVNTAHGMGLRVLLDVVHSHASANVLEGLNMFDGTDCQFFHAGDKGWHPAWGTKLFDYSKHEVLHFLLSNLKFWQDEYHFDGFRFDGVTSMLYHDHGLGVAFDHYDRYFSMNTDVEAVTYLQLANELVHANDPRALTVAEDMSGMPGMCLPLDDGGIGFDFRLAMGMPDYWIRMMKTRDEDWNMFTMWHELTSRRYLEGNIAYCESHDQALVGDKTLIFYLADAEMYSGMNKEYRTPSMDRAIALHKMIRFVTLALGGEGYLNFMGNEFGHPEWIDFPRLGNGWSFKYARRQWHLVDDPALKYDWLQAFDRGMTALAAEYDIPGSGYAQSLWTDDQRKILAFSRGGLVFVFGFHPTYSEPAFTLPVNTCGPGRYQVIFSTDDADFGGDERISKDYIYETRQDEQYGSCFEIYVPARSAMVLKRLGDLPEAAGAEE